MSVRSEAPVVGERRGSDASEATGTKGEGLPMGPSGQRKGAESANKRQKVMGGATEKQLLPDCGNNFVLCQQSCDLGISSMPVEILLKILSYLDYRDLYALRGVSKFFGRLALEPSLWTAYKVDRAGPSTSDVIEELKRMPHLRKIGIDGRNDCDDILKQLSCSNKELQRLSISDCTGSAANLYLRPAYLIRILERCSRLHTITIRGSRFRGLKFYRLLGNIGHRLRLVKALTTCTQFQTFAKHLSNLDEQHANALCSMCFGTGRWVPLRYYAMKRSDRTKGAQISHLYHHSLYVGMRSASK